MLIVSLGDPLSVNVELLLPLLADGPSEPATKAESIILVGSAWHWRDQTQRLGAERFRDIPTYGLSEVLALSKTKPLPPLVFVDVARPDLDRPAETLDPQGRGLLSVVALSSIMPLSEHLLASGERLAVLTGPIDKHACHAAGFAFPGQTEFFERLWEHRAVMILAGPRLRVGLVTNHLALADVPKTLSRTLIAEKLTLFAKTLQSSFGIALPRIAVCGLNPHAGDSGLFGDEEARLISPAIEDVRAIFPQATLSGPLPADTVFHRAYHGHYDGVLAMYHDQGLGPLKTVHFDDGVNLSGGLPHLRVSPDHGPAADLFLKKSASGASWRYAFDLALACLNGSSQ